jgi:hypothetical protein
MMIALVREDSRADRRIGADCIGVRGRLGRIHGRPRGKEGAKQPVSRVASCHPQPRHMMTHYSEAAS